MLVNFALDVIGTKITSDKVSTDGYECLNLISSNWHLRRKGFLAEHFLKPPVNVTLEFPCSICIHSILVSPCVGRQQSSEIELYSASKPVSRTLYLKKMLNASCLKSEASSSFKVNGALPGTKSATPIFYPLSKVSVSANNRICFYNEKFGMECNVDFAHGDPSYNEHRVRMNHFRKEITTASSHLIIRIVRTQHGSTAAISNIDVWGLPALSVPAGIKDDVINKYMQFIKPPALVKESPNYSSDGKKDASGSNPRISLDQEEMDIPEEFIDPLTCEVMAIPMLLPCGKNVDLSTLDRFFNAEASYCRQPRDPFTGVEFSNAIRPIPNGALKTRIDQFLMKHCNDTSISKIARTVGQGKRKASDDTAIGVSSLIAQNDRALSMPKKLNVVTGNESKCNYVLSPDLISEPKTSQGTKQDYRRQKTSSVPYCDKRLNNSQSADLIIDCKNAFTLTSHENKLKNSLDDALSSILSGLTSYSSASVQQDPPEKNSMCSICKEMLRTETVSYVLPCQHIVCRKCLTLESAGPSHFCCGSCGSAFDKSAVTRRHQHLKTI